MNRGYEMTLVPDSTFRRLSPTARRRLVYALHAITGAGLWLGCFDHDYWEWVVVYSAVHALLFVGLVGLRPLAFPAQLRIAHTLWLIVGVYVPQMTWMMYVTTVGLSTNLAFGYCPLSRLLSLLPWNRQVPLSPRTLWRTFFTRPMAGRFAVPAPRPSRV